MKLYRAGSVAKKAIACMLAGSMAFSSLATASVALAQPSDDLKVEYDAAMAELSSLESALAQAEAELGKTTYELGQTKDSIAGLQEKIAQNQAKLDVARNKLAVVIAESYKQGGDVSLLELVLSSNSLDELVSRIYYANKTAESKQSAIHAVSDLQEGLMADKATLEVQERQQEELLSSQKTQFVAMEESAERQAAYVGQLSEEVTAAMEEERRQATATSLSTARELLGDERVNEVVPPAVVEAIGQAPAAAKEGDAEQPKAEQAEQGEGKSQSLVNAATQALKSATAEVKQEVAETAPEPEPEPEPVVSEPEPEPEPEPAPVVEEPEPEPEPVIEEEEDSSEQQAAFSVQVYGEDAASIAVNAAISQVGVPYGHDNDGTNWDCNGLTHFAWSMAGVEIPYASGTYAYGQFQWLQSSGNWVTDASSLKAGDLVFFSQDGGSTCYHVALYIGGGQIVHAVGYGYGVQITSLDYVSGFCGGGSPA